MIELPKSVKEEIEKRVVKRLSVLMADVNYFVTAARNITKQAIEEIYKQIPEDIDPLLLLPEAKKLGLEIKLTTLSEKVVTEYAQRDSIISASIRNEYIMSKYESAYETSRLAGINSDTWFINPGKAEKAWGARYKLIKNAKSLTKKQRKQAGQITEAIKQGLDTGIGSQELSRKIDIVLGLRDKTGKLTAATLTKIKNGELVFRNGHMYDSYRIARTELRRARSFAVQDEFDDARKKGIPKRLKKKSVIDSRTREQSILMNGNLSDEKGRFEYPQKGSGAWFYPYNAPKQYMINDRGTFFPVLPGTSLILEENKDEAKELARQFGENDVKNMEKFKKKLKGGQFERKHFKEYAEFANANRLPIDPIINH